MIFVLQHSRRFDRQHASLSRGSAGIYLTDLNSGHGIFVEGQRIEKNIRVLLKNGVGIRFSNLQRCFFVSFFFLVPRIFEAVSVSGIPSKHIFFRPSSHTSQVLAPPHGSTTTTNPAVHSAFRPSILCLLSAP